MAHGRTVCPHGTIVAQCRCLGPHGDDVVVACPTWCPQYGEPVPDTPAPGAAAAGDAEPDIRIVRSGRFLTATVAKRVVAVRWDNGITFWVTDGTGPAEVFRDGNESMGRFMAIAVDASGGDPATIRTDTA